MKFSIFLFLQLFMLTTSNFYVLVFQAKPDDMIEKLPYDPTAELKHEESYIFVRLESEKINIIYWVGAQASGVKRVNTAHVTAYIMEDYRDIITKIRILITRETSKPGIDNFNDLISDYAPEKIPRLYKVAGVNNIRQVQLNKNQITTRDSFVLDDGFCVTIHHSRLTTKTKINIANSLAEYIINVDNDKNYGRTVIPSSENVNKYTSAFTEFWKKILNTVEKSGVGNSKTVNKKFKEKMNVVTNSDDAVSFEKLWKGTVVLLDENMPRTRENISRTQAKSLHSDRPSTSATASTSTHPTHSRSKKMSKAIKMKTILKVLKNSSYFEHVLEYRGVPPNFTVSNSGNYKYGDLILLYMGPEECIPRSQSYQIDTLKSRCVYMLKDFENNEIFIYFGKDTDFISHDVALSAAEIDFLNNQSGKITIILEGQKIPTPFQIHIEDKYTNMFTPKKEIV